MWSDIVIREEIWIYLTIDHNNPDSYTGSCHAFLRAFTVYLRTYHTLQGYLARLRIYSPNFILLARLLVAGIHTSRASCSSRSSREYVVQALELL